VVRLVVSYCHCLLISGLGLVGQLEVLWEASLGAQMAVTVATVARREVVVRALLDLQPEILVRNGSCRGVALSQRWVIHATIVRPSLDWEVVRSRY